MLHIIEAQVRELLSVSECINVLRNAFSLGFINIPRYRLKSKNSLLHVMSASVPELGMMGLKAYGTSKDNASFLVLLFDEKSGSLMAVVEADALGQIRTGAASGLATDFLANRDARIGAVIGSGYQAETQLSAIDVVRELHEIRIFSRTPAKREAFVQRMRERVRARLVETSTAEECVSDADIVCTITGSKDPVLLGRWLKQGCHINAAGSNWVGKRELDEEAVRRCDLICVDHREQSKIESGDLISVLQQQPDAWERVIQLTDLVNGKAGRSSSQQITLFKSNGIAMEDIAAAHCVYSKLNP